MRRTTILNAKQVKRTSFSEAEQLFTKHCKLKNLSPQTMRYYAEDLKYFHACVPVQYVDEVSQDAFENFIVSELDAGKKITSLNSRIRGLRVFFKFCAEREYMKPIISSQRTFTTGAAVGATGTTTAFSPIKVSRSDA